MSEYFKIDVESYRQNGYVIVENLLTPDEVAALKNEMLCICKGERAKIKGLQQHKPNEPEEEILKVIHSLQLIK